MVEGDGPCISGIGDITERNISVRKITVRLKRTCMEDLLHNICFSKLCTIPIFPEAHEAGNDRTHVRVQSPFFVFS